MKKVTTISLSIFGLVLIVILAVSLLSSPGKKVSNSVSDSQTQGVIVNNSTSNNQTQSETANNQDNSNSSVSAFSMSEISKHNNKNDCWLLIDGKVYDITDFFGSHPGGNGVMEATCGTDATVAYATKDPYATSASRGEPHSSRAESMLDSYYIGDFLNN